LFPHSHCNFLIYDWRQRISNTVVKSRQPKIEAQKPGGFAFISLGSNLGDSRQIVLEAMAWLQKLSDEPMLRSSLWKTSPVDCPPDSPNFVNAVVGLVPQKNETPESLLVKLRNLEKHFGRQPKTVLNEPRPLDLDLIAFGSETRQTPELTIPHPRAHLRRFVLQPLNEIAPDLVLAGQGRTVSELLADLVFDEALTRLDS
jgi:2-amino-4-hydroxy-6-hydroxymethyldihydropteridine diphosphokinase